MKSNVKVAELCRYLSKSGTLSDYASYLRELSSDMTPEEAADLYSCLRDESQRWEREWRDEFIRYFPQCVPLLKPIDDAEFWQDELFGLIRTGNLDNVKTFITHIRTSQQTFEPKVTYAECLSLGYRDGVSDVPVDFYPIEGENEDGVNSIQFARSLNHLPIAEYLQGIIAELDARYVAAYEQGRSIS